MPSSGILQKMYVKEEATFDTQQAIAATDAVDMVSLDITPEMNEVPINSHVGTGSYQGEIDGSTGGKWQAVCDLMPAAAAIAPDIGPALKAAFGTETIVGGTSVTYVFNDSAPSSLQWVKSAEEIQEVATGCWVETLTIEAQQNQVPRLTFAGGIAGFGRLLGAPTTTGTNAISATTINLTTNHGYKFAVRGASPYVKFGSEDNAGAGYKVTAHTASTITISPGLAAQVNAGAVVASLVPSQTLAGTRISAGVEHALTIDSASIGMISAKCSIATGIKARDKQSSSSRPTGIYRTGGRTVDLDIDAYYLDEGAIYLGAANFATQVLRDVAIRLGSSTIAKRATINADKTRFKVQPVSLQDAEIAVMKLLGRPRQNAAANDECSFVFD